MALLSNLLSWSELFKVRFRNYTMSDAMMTWSEAETWCKDRNAKLAKWDTNEKWIDVAHMAGKMEYLYPGRKGMYSQIQRRRGSEGGLDGASQSEADSLRHRRWRHLRWSIGN